jgi:Protein of unknown function (DUF3738)
LTFSRQRNIGAPLDANADAAPDIFTPVQEQLCLKLQHDKKMMPVFVVTTSSDRARISDLLDSEASTSDRPVGVPERAVGA